MALSRRHVIESSLSSPRIGHRSDSGERRCSPTRVRAYALRRCSPQDEHSLFVFRMAISTAFWWALATMLIGVLSSRALRADDGAADGPSAKSGSAEAAPAGGSGNSPASERNAETPEPRPAEVGGSSELEVAAIERRARVSRHVSRRIPLLLLDRAVSEVAGPTTEARARERHARRIAARYSIQALTTVPKPVESYSWRSSEERVTPLEPYVPRLGERLAERERVPTPRVGGTSSRGFFHSDLIAEIEPRIGPRERGLQRLASRLALRHARRFLRNSLQEDFESDPTFGLQEYENRKSEIWRIGRAPESTRFHAEESYAEFRSGVQDLDDPEQDIPLVEWGPLRIDDSGSLGVDLKSLLGRRAMPRDITLATEHELEPGDPALARGPGPRGRSLFSGRSYRVDTDFRFTPHGGALAVGAVREFFGKIRASVGVDFYSSMLRNRYMSAELEGWVRPDGEAALFMNWVLYCK